jgi:hypothetical protein
MKNNLATLRSWILASSFVLLATSALAGTTYDVSGRPDMRLWSFGDCERKFPNADTEEYKECMRVVGSQEAKDLRAQRMCEDSFASDHVGLERCVSAYRLSQERAANATIPQTHSATTLPPEMTPMVQSIAAAAVEQRGTTPEEAVVTEAVTTEAATVRARSSSTSLVLVGALAIVLLGVGGAVVLRSQV